ncbi:hypothetical protein [Helicobacter salomonis]|uniref:hypothetical protein n=1 Tax=Helicobacter salomonis TaxID=56878 RepID=UPI000CF14663|nr:hypothetical protein [Helicobacter salomonis]
MIKYATPIAGILLAFQESKEEGKMLVLRNLVTIQSHYKLHQCIACIRADFLHKLTTYLIRHTNKLTKSLADVS